MGSLRWLVVLVAACGPDPTASSPIGLDQSGESFEPSGSSATRLEQTLDSTIADSLSLACADNIGTTENSWYRVFSLKDAGVIDRTLDVHRVNFGVQTATGRQRVQISIGIYSGEFGAQTLDLSKIEMLAMSAVDVPPTLKGEMLQVSFPATEIPPNVNLVVEIHSPAHTREGYFYPGATKAGETGPTYLRAPACAAATPTAVAQLGHPETHMIVALSGSY